MVDRLIDLPYNHQEIENIKKSIADNGYAWFFEGENSDYIPMEAIAIYKDEAQSFLDAAQRCYELYQQVYDSVDLGNLWSRLEIPEAAVPIIKYSWEQKHPHLLGRFDFAGGLADLPVKLIEFNADTCTQLPEASVIQNIVHEPIRKKYKGQINYLISDIERELFSIKNARPSVEPTLLLTSLGHIEDRLNLEVVREAAQRAGFIVDYADLENVIFDEDAVLLQAEDGGYVQYNYMYKLVPWEFIMHEEPELLKILTDLVINHNLMVMNPAYSIVFQSKRLMSILYKLYASATNYLLPTYNEKDKLKYREYVEKVNFGRLGENIAIYDASGRVVEATDGDWGDSIKVYQEKAQMYFDKDDDTYQAGVYLVNGKPSCIAFRRQDALIIGDDSEFLTHVLL